MFPDAQYDFFLQDMAMAWAVKTIAERLRGIGGTAASQ